MFRIHRPDGPALPPEPMNNSNCAYSKLDFACHLSLLSIVGCNLYNDPVSGWHPCSPIYYLF